MCASDGCQILGFRAFSPGDCTRASFIRLMNIPPLSSDNYFPVIFRRGGCRIMDITALSSLNFTCFLQIRRLSANGYYCSMCSRWYTFSRVLEYSSLFCFFFSRSIRVSPTNLLEGGNPPAWHKSGIDETSSAPVCLPSKQFPTESTFNLMLFGLD